MKLPDYRPRIRKGQVWLKKNSKYGIKIIVTGSTSSRYYLTARYDNRKIVHHITEKDLWIYYDLVEKNSR